MKKFGFICLVLLASFQIGAAQVSGGAGAYTSNSGGTSVDAISVERSKRQPTSAEIKNDDASTYLDAAVLMNVKADEYVAVFALFSEGETPAIAGRQMDDTLAQFTAALDKLGVTPAQRSVDFISQSRLYSFDTTTEEVKDEEGRLVAVEKLSGFELKKNLSIRFGDIAKVDDFTAAAASVGVFDLVKVDYIVKDAAAIQERLQLQTMNLIRQKAARYGATLGLKLGDPTQIVADLPSVYFPVDQYDSYTAVETEKVLPSYNRSRTTVITARKSSSIYFNPLRGDGFDAVINPVIVEPVVQFTTYIKVKFAPQKR